MCKNFVALSVIACVMVGSCLASSSPKRPRSTDLTNSAKHKRRSSFMDQVSHMFAKKEAPVYASRDEEYLYKYLPTWNRFECESALDGVNSEIAYFDQYEAECERYLIKNADKSETSWSYAAVLTSLNTTRVLHDTALRRQLLITERLAECDGTDNDSSSDSEVRGSLYARYGII